MVLNSVPDKEEEQTFVITMVKSERTKTATVGVIQNDDQADDQR